MKSIPIKLWKKYLKSKGLRHIRTKSSHEIWDIPDGSLLRPITVDKNYTDVPITHIHTSLKTLDINKKVFLKELEKLKRSKKK